MTQTGMQVHSAQFCVLQFVLPVMRPAVALALHAPLAITRRPLAQEAVHHVRATSQLPVPDPLLQVTVVRTETPRRKFVERHSCTMARDA